MQIHWKKKWIRHIIDDLEMFPDDSDEECLFNKRSEKFFKLPQALLFSELSFRLIRSCL